MYDSSKVYSCPMIVTRDIIGGKWKILILWRLSKNTYRFSELKRQIPKISEKMLTQQLRELESDNIISRKVYPQVPPKVEYSLTDKGITLVPILNMMATWGDDYLREAQE